LRFATVPTVAAAKDNKLSQRKEKSTEHKEHKEGKGKILRNYKNLTDELGR